MGIAELYKLPFEELYQWMRSAIYPRILRLCWNDHADADDVFSEVAFTTWLALARNEIRNPEYLAFWIHQTARFKAWDFRRAKAKFLPLDKRQPKDAVPSHEGLVITKYLLSRRLKRLNPQYVYSLVSTKSNKDLSLELGITEHGVACMRSIARNQLRRILSK